MAWQPVNRQPAMPRPTTTTPPARRPRSRLTREQVARAALDYLDRHGLESLSMRRLAAELGVGAMTLYGYYGSKQELLDAVVDAAVSGRPGPIPDGPWQDQLIELMRRARHNIGRHPALAKLRATQPVLRPEALRFAEAALSILRGAGFDKREATLSFRLLFTYVFGYVTFSPQERAAEARRDAFAAVRALPPDEYPNLTSAIDEAAAAMAGDEAFEYGLARIVGGFEARLAERGR
jgi:AcrR family transcriptional regulator